MIFTPESLKKQQFSKAFRGFDKEEVHAFLEKLSTEFESLINDNESIKQELDESKLKLEQYLEIEQKLNKEISDLRKKSTKKIDEANKKSEEILKSAEEKAKELVQKSQDEAEKLKSALLQLREERDTIIAKLKTIINYQSHVLEMGFEDKYSSEKGTEKIESGKDVDVNIDELVKKLL